MYKVQKTLAELRVQHKEDAYKNAGELTSEYPYEKELLGKFNVLFDLANTVFQYIEHLDFREAEMNIVKLEEMLDEEAFSVDYIRYFGLVLLHRLTSASSLDLGVSILHCINSISIERDREKLVRTILYILSCSLDVGENNQAEKVTSKYVLYIKEYIEKHYMEEISFNSLANQLHLSRNYLSYLFKKEMGMSFMNYLVHYRIDKAKKLIKHGGLQICEVSEKVGYQDPAYFSRIFKNITGKCPSNF